MSTTERQLLQKLAESIDIPRSAYEKAAGRYADLAGWFSRSESSVLTHDPHIYPQGSFRLGTMVRPITDDGEYDLDVGCRLRTGASCQTVIQERLKNAIGDELRQYRAARNITAPVDEMRRCWRLSYKDDLPFHIDVVPSIPEEWANRAVLVEAMTRFGLSPDQSARFAEFSGCITDTEHPQYRVITNDWYVSNSSGYAAWFESRMRLASAMLHERAIRAGNTKIDDLPPNQWKSPLQAAVQILKRHRDIMFANQEGAPISIIITTLAASAYQGEASVAAALRTITANMKKQVRSQAPRVPNPVNPREDFADKWSEPHQAHKQLEAKFWRWLAQVERDFNMITTSKDPSLIVEEMRKSFGVRMEKAEIAAAMADESLLSAAAAPAGLTFPSHAVKPNNPAGFA